MSAITRNLLLLLAMTIAVSPLRAAWHGHSVRTAHDGHVHYHAHDHGGVTEAHAHYHHHGENHDDGSDHHDGVLDHGESGPTVFWTAPVGTRIAPPPACPRRTAVDRADAVGLDALARAKPPPRSLGHHEHLDLVRITVLRL